MLRQREGTVYGGSELRAWRFARGFADSGFEVSIVGFDDEGAPSEMLGPVSIVTGSAHPGIFSRLVQLFGHDIEQSRPWKAANADVYVIFGVAEYSSALAKWCKKSGRPLVLF